VADKYGQAKAQMTHFPLTERLSTNSNLDMAGTTLPSTNDYRSMVGSLMCVVVMTRPDVAYAVKELLRLLESKGPPLEVAWQALRYLGTTASCTKVPRIRKSCFVWILRLGLGGY